MMTAVLNDYPDYIIYSDGRIYANSTKKCFVKASITFDGYRQVNLKSIVAKNGYRQSIKVHRIVAMAFVGNPHGHKEVNHKDGNKLNNDASNLEWVSRSENIKHAYSIGLMNNKGVLNGNYKTGKYITS